jgi:hypothetical protein
MIDRVIEVDADLQPRKWRDGRDSRGAGVLPTLSKRKSSERDAPMPSIMNTSVRLSDPASSAVTLRGTR